MRSIALTIMLLAVCSPANAAKGAREYLHQPTEWFAGAEAARVAANILSFQSDLGGWPKNTDTVSHPYAGTDRQKDLKPTFDNSGTTDELRFLARIYNATQKATYKDAFLRGYDYILQAQYPTGGWPQFFPPPEKTYHRHITFNDDTMVRLLIFLRETANNQDYAFLDNARRQSARQAFDRGIACILKCQIRVNGNLTAWCAQHDEKDFSPQPGRTFELTSLSGSESVGITRLLMSLDHPSPEVIESVNAAIAWFQSAKLSGIRVVRQDDKDSPKGWNKVVVQDPNAPPLWARFYDIQTNRPIFSDRDGVAQSNLSEIGYERRNGYAWLGDWPKSLLEKDYPAWKAKWSTNAK